MSWKNLKDGTYNAVAQAARTIKAKTGKIGVEVRFKFQNGTDTEYLNWVGWLSEAAIENTMKTLVDVLEFNGDDTFGAGCINTVGEVSIVVKNEPSQDDPSKIYPRIQFVNKLGGSAFKGLEPEEVKQQLGAIGFKAAFEFAKKDLGRKPNVPNHAPQTTGEKLPF